MKPRFLAVLCGTGLICALTASEALAHGGSYPGPGDIVPPGATPPPRTEPPVTPPPGGPPPGPMTPPAPAPGPVAPSPTTPGGPGTGSSNGGSKTGGIALTPDLSRWQFWWERNKDPFLLLKDAVHSGRVLTGDDEIYLGASRRSGGFATLGPSAAQIDTTILPALKRALDGTSNRDIVSSCLMALAKIGRDHERFQLLVTLKPYLKSHDQEIRETAALAMGVSAMPAAARDLTDLVLDRAAGRALCGRRKVDHRTRSFAAYGLGLVAHANADLNVKRNLLDTMKAVLVDRDIVDRNIRVAAIEALSLLNVNAANPGASPGASLGDAEEKLLQDTLSVLMGFYERKLGRGTELIQSHVPTAVAKLIGRGQSKLHQHYKARFAADLGQHNKKSHDIHRACALALGQLAVADKADARYSKLLRDYYNRGRDTQARYFALMAMGQIGGNDNRNELLKELARGKKVLERPWAAMALGTLAFHARKNGSDPAALETIGCELLKQFKKARAPYAKGAMAVAVGLSGHRAAGRELKEQFLRFKHQDEFAGYLCIGMALLPYREAQSEILEVARVSFRRPELLMQAAIALGKMGHKEATATLIQMLRGREVNLAKMSAIARALAFIGDRSTVRPLRDMLFNDQLTPLTRAFAAVALGGIADKEKLPWNSKIGRNMNYRAAVETLIQSGSGVLDIL